MKFSEITKIPHKFSKLRKYPRITTTKNFQYTRHSTQIYYPRNPLSFINSTFNYSVSLSMSSNLIISTDFESLEKLKQACREYAISNAFEFTTIYSDSRHYQIACKADNCSWRLYASPVQTSSV